MAECLGKDVRRLFEEMKDDEIISCIRQGDAEAMDFLLERYKGLVKKKANALYLIGGEKEDIIQEGMIGLYKAVRDYNSEKEAAFSTFAELCVARQIYTAISASNKKRNQPLNNYISFEQQSEELADIARNGYVTGNPEEAVIGRENAKQLKEFIDKELSSLEKKVIGFYLEGYSYMQIAEMLEKKPKSIDNAIQRIRSKLKKYIAFYFHKKEVDQ